MTTINQTEQSGWRTGFVRRQLSIVVLSAALSGTLLAPAAQACRDCPFPMGVGRWVTPDGNIEIDISEQHITARQETVYVTLRSRATGQVLAQGTSRMRNGDRNLNVYLSDNAGEPVYGSIDYLDDTHEHIQARFNCDSCQIRNMIDSNQ